MLARACPDDGRSADDGDSTFRLTRAPQFPAQLANDRRLRLVRIDHRVDELKNVGVHGRSLHRNDADALMAHDNLVPFVDIEKLHRTGRALLTIDRTALSIIAGRTSISLPSSRINVCWFVVT